MGEIQVQSVWRGPNSEENWLNSEQIAPLDDYIAERMSGNRIEKIFTTSKFPYIAHASAGNDLRGNLL